MGSDALMVWPVVEDTKAEFEMEQSVAEGAAQAWDMACRQTAKAWHGAGVGRLMRREVVEHALQVLEQGDAQAIAELIVDMSGNAAMVAAAGGTSAIVGRQRGGIDASRVKAIACAVVEAILLPLLAARQPGQPLDVESLKTACRHWVVHGELPADACPPGPNGPRLQEDLRQITVLMAGGCDAEEAGAIRLGALSVVAPSIQSLCLAILHWNSAQEVRSASETSVTPGRTPACHGASSLIKSGTCHA